MQLATNCVVTFPWPAPKVSCDGKEVKIAWPVSTTSTMRRFWSVDDALVSKVDYEVLGGAKRAMNLVHWNDEIDVGLVGNQS